MSRVLIFTAVAAIVTSARPALSDADDLTTTCDTLLAEASATRRDEGADAAARRVHAFVLAPEAKIDPQCRLDLVRFLGASCEALDGAPLYSCAELLEDALVAVNASPNDRLFIQDNVLIRVFKQYQQDSDASGAKKTLRERRMLIANSPPSLQQGAMFDLLLKEGDFYFDNHRLDEAESSYQELLKLSIQSKEFDDLDVVVPLGRLARVQEARGNFEQARSYSERVIHIIETRDGRDSVALVLPLEQYGRIMTALGKTGIAEEAIQRARHLREQ
jgi:tetratricopeptide (TPR) repeat protein